MKIPIIAYVHIARITASIFSIAGGYVYTVNTVGLIADDNITKNIIASILLILLELGGVLFLYKSISDILYKKKQVYIYIIPALAFLFLSFLLTTNGAVMWIKQKNDKQGKLIKTHKKNITNNAFFYEDAIKTNKQIYDSIASIKVHKWKTAREMQIVKLQFYASEIARLQENKNAKENSKLQNLEHAISKNNTAIKYNSKKYYWLAVIIMLSVLYFNFLLVWLNFKTKKPEIEPKETKIFVEVSKKHDTEKILELVGKMKQKDIAEKLGLHPSKVSRTIKKHKVI